MAKSKDRIPKFLNSYPNDLATLVDLKREGLEPKGTPVALLEIVTKDSQTLTGLYRRSEATPVATPAGPVDR
ncbi:hypothetical protein [Deinococcus multiflagellatus]|uniref:Uncharacterized protein n=2 Tax=Deinococcus multiflagellatus TaxID=1656887 RepID=A0ABW1ZSP3_9DEIO